MKRRGHSTLHTTKTSSTKMTSSDTCEEMFRYLRMMVMPSLKNKNKKQYRLMKSDSVCARWRKTTMLVRTVYSLDISELVSQEAEVLDPEDTSWVDRSMIIEADDTVRVKVVGCQRNKATARHPKPVQMDFDVEVGPVPKGLHIDSRQAFSDPRDLRRASKSGNK